MRLRLRRMMDPTVPSDPLPLVLFYTSFFGRMPPAASAPSPPVCRTTCDRAQIGEADIVLFHLPDAWEMGDAVRQPGQIWVAYMMESPAHYPLWRDPDFMNRFDLVMSHERSADIWTPYLHSADAWREAMAKPVPAKTELAPVVLFQSANVDRNGRNDFAFDLMKAIRVDSYGKLFHNRDLGGPDLGRATKLDTIGRYHFCCAFENATTPDYVTEKVFDALLAGTVPIYRGTRDISAFVPPGSYIDAADFPSAGALADHLRRVRGDPAAYARYFAWRDQPLPDSILSWIRDLERPVLARVLEAAAARFPAGGPRDRPRLPFGVRAYLRTKLRRFRRARLSGGRRG